MLSREQILAAVDRRTTTLASDVFGGDVTIQWDNGAYKIFSL